ncbi:MAG: ABC transporter ATP-binding protein [Thermoanaerobaculia bacterium]
MIELRKLNKSYTVGRNTLHVLKGIDLEIGASELVAVMGASGSGKSTLMNILGLLDRYDSGEYTLDGVDMRELSETKAAQYRSRYIGFVFQSFHLVPFKNALENVALPLYYQGVSRKERHERAAVYLEKVGLAERAEHLPSELSGGQQQRVAIARALVAQPKLLLADEPTGALDSATSRDVMKVLQGVQKDGVSVVIITHERDIARMTDRLIHLVDGNIAGDTRQRRLDPAEFVVDVEAIAAEARATLAEPSSAEAEVAGAGAKAGAR